MRILIADDQIEVRSALRLLLREEPTMLTLSEAASTAELVEKAATGFYDIILMDWELPGFQPEKILPRLRATLPSVIIIALNSLSRTRHSSQIPGADEYVSKGDSPAHLLSVLRKYATRQN